jgi:hypothetical protein
MINDDRTAKGACGYLREEKKLLRLVEDICQTIDQNFEHIESKTYNSIIMEVA